MWVRDYVFMAPYKLVAERAGRWQRAAAYPLLFLTLFVVGIWHGGTRRIRGLRNNSRNRGGDQSGLRQSIAVVAGASGPGQIYENRVVELLAVVLTFHVICFSLLFFSMGALRPFAIARNISSALHKGASICPQVTTAQLQLLCTAQLFLPSASCGMKSSLPQSSGCANGQRGCRHPVYRGLCANGDRCDCISRHLGPAAPRSNPCLSGFLNRCLHADLWSRKSATGAVQFSVNENPQNLHPSAQ